MSQKAIDCVYAAVDEVNQERAESPLEKSPDTVIQGPGGSLDSLGLINFVVAVEENVERAFGTPILISDDRTLAQDPSPLRSIGALSDYIETLLREQGVQLEPAPRPSAA